MRKCNLYSLSPTWILDAFRGIRFSTTLLKQVPIDTDAEFPPFLNHKQNPPGGIQFPHIKCIWQSLDLPGFHVHFAAYAYLLRSSGSAGALPHGRRIHDHIIRSVLEKDAFLGSLLVQMYIRCGAMEDAYAYFVKMHERNVFSWNYMIRAFAREDQGREAYHFFQQMQQESVLPDKFIFASIIAAFSSGGAFLEGKQMHARIMAIGFELDVVMATAVVDMYCKCGSLEDARFSFDQLSEKNVVSWNVIIAAYVRHSHTKEAFQLFDLMQQEGVLPDKVSIVSILASCSSLAALTYGKNIHVYIMHNGFEFDDDVMIAVINMYGKCGSLEDARKMFENLPEQTLVSWNVMIGACVCNGKCKDAIQLFERMHWEGVIPDKFTFASILSAHTGHASLNRDRDMHAYIVSTGFELDVVVVTALISMYGQNGHLVDARILFDNLPTRTVVSWNAIIAAYTCHGYCQIALQLFDQLQQEGAMPNEATFASILCACANLEALTKGKHIHINIICSGLESDVVLSTALVNMYGRCGSLMYALDMFYNMAERNVVSWNAIIAVHAQSGHGKVVLQVFEQMQQEGVVPDKVTFVSVLSACSHAGLVDEGCYVWTSMNQDHVLVPTPEHYDCMIGLLGRAGRLGEAERMISKMPFQPSCVSWTTILGACRNQVDVERGEHAVKHLFELYPTDASSYVILSNIYAAAGRNDDAENVLKMMRSQGLKEESGCSSLEINDDFL